MAQAVGVDQSARVRVGVLSVREARPVKPLARMRGAMGLALIAAVFGLFLPDSWADALFAWVLVAAVLGLYDANAADEARRQYDRRAAALTEDRARELWGDRVDWPAWKCAGCDDTVRGQLLACPFCDWPRTERSKVAE